jgi:hypothetical protein
MSPLCFKIPVFSHTRLSPKRVLFSWRKMLFHLQYGLKYSRESDLYYGVSLYTHSLTDGFRPPRIAGRCGLNVDSCKTCRIWVTIFFVNVSRWLLRMIYGPRVFTAKQLHVSLQASTGPGYRVICFYIIPECYSESLLQEAQTGAGIWSIYSWNIDTGSPVR